MWTVLVIGTAEVEPGQHGGTLRQFKGREDGRRRAAVLNGDVVEFSVYYAGSQTLIFNPQKEETCPGGRGGEANNICCQGVSDVGLHGLSLAG